MVPVLLIALVHALTTAGRALLALIIAGTVHRRPLVAGLHVVIFALCIAVGALAGLTCQWFEDYVPQGRELTVALWTAVLAGVLGAYVIRATSAENVESYLALQRSRSQIPPELWDAAAKAAMDAGAEPRLVQAFMLVENVQRPAWTRRLERMAGKILGRASYGPLQVTANAPLSEHDALAAAVRQRFAGRAVPTKHAEWGSQPDTQWLRLFALGYNPDSSYGDDVVSAYYSLENPTSSAPANTAVTADDGLPEVEATTFDQRGQHLTVAGTLKSTQTDEINATFVDVAGSKIHAERVRASGDDRRLRRLWAARLDVPAGAANLTLAARPDTALTPDAMIILPVLDA
jgi:hypothetical protein